MSEIVHDVTRDLTGDVTITKNTLYDALGWLDLANRIDVGA
jgi:hypothetical protein